MNLIYAKTLSWRTVWSLSLVFLAVMNSVLNPVLHSALRCETQCHTPPSQSRLGLQVASCLPVFLSSGTAGAINQNPPPPPLAWVWTATQHYKGVSSEHFSASSPHFQAFPDSLVWHFPAGEPFSPTTPIYWEFWPGLIFTLGHFWGASDGSKLEYHWSGSSQHVQSQAPLHLQMERIEAHYCVLGGASSSVNSLAHF